MEISRSSEKKWFVYVTDHHEGPFSVDEIGLSIQAGKYSRFSFVWCQGMTDWLPMSEVEEFQVYTLTQSKPAIVVPPSVPEAPKPEIRPEPRMEMGSQSSERTVTTFVEVEDLKGAFPKATPAAEKARVNPLDQMTSKPISEGSQTNLHIPSPKPRSMLVPTLVILVLTIGATVLYRLGFLDPVLNSFETVVSGIPNLPDVAPEELVQLKSIAKSPLSMGPLVGIALSKADPLAPQVYIVTNLSDGAKFDVYLSGIPHTLLNASKSMTNFQVVCEKHMVKTSPLRSVDQGPLPRGEYQIFVLESENGQPSSVESELSRLSVIQRQLPDGVPANRRIAFSKRVFIGSKDETYFERLKEYHEKILGKAQAETSELKQIYALVTSQMESSVTNFDRLKRQTLGPRQIKAWEDFKQAWSKLQEQLKTVAQPGETPVQQNLFQFVSALASGLDQQVNIQDKFFKGEALVTLDPVETGFRTKLQDNIGKLRDVLDTLTSNPKDENGMPTIVTLKLPEWNS